ncbi:hypothetical protein KVR01_011306 [Diaporthe batatas]|uniref:uncharacterized protein n=1 Tax=Diaporthe batatas TaxID=748121 RepID=UPI001D059C3D|nr:uncharacterized protein KVR01_011306 [Diaporthe batatas]KAG8158863.1 hypothetical protein KVR01_011306 [Diaporthe batatas]
MPRPSSSFYSQDDKAQANLGYTPFEYWKGPKPVVWAATRQAPVHNSIAKAKTHGRKLSSSRAAARISAKAHPGGNPVNSLRQFEPIQPSKLYSAQQFVASLQAAKLADTKHHNRHPHVEYVGSRGDIGQFRAATALGDKKSSASTNPWGDPDDKGRLKRLEAIQESAQRGWADASYPHHGDYKTPAGVRTSHKELLLSRSQSTRSSPPDYADLPPLNMSRKASKNLPPRYGYYGDERPDRWWDLRTWRRRTWAILVAIVVVIVIVVVVVVTMLQKNNAYPNYKRLVYTLSDEYSGSEFFDNFDYFTGYDPTHGFVHYVPREQAEALNLTYASPSSAVLRVDTSVGPSSTPDASTGRFSVRATSKRQYGSSGLFVFDVMHTPHGCGTWPALWLADPANWPDNGEMDVMEATNLGDEGNAMTLHTSSGCGMGGHRRKMTGESVHGSCASTGGADNAGCGVEGPAATYGEAFNAGGGGVMALEWRSAGIRMWQFPRAAVPADITGGEPDPSTWGTALADFPDTGCDIDKHFRNQSIIMNIDLCGDLAGSLYGGTSCPSNCTDFVANNPDEFVNAYWEVGAFRVYTAA